MSEQKIVLEYLERRGKELDRHLRDIDRQRDEIAADRDAVRRLVLSLRGAPDPPGQPDEEETVDADPQPAAPPPTPDRPPELADLRVDYTGARNLLARLCCIGRAVPDGILRVGSATQLLIADGLSNGQFRNLRRNVDEAFRRHPEDFTYLGPGTYRYVGDSAESAENPR